MHITFEDSAPFEVKDPKQARSNEGTAGSWMVWCTKKRSNTQKTITKKAGSVDMWCHILRNLVFLFSFHCLVEEILLTTLTSPQPCLISIVFDDNRPNIESDSEIAWYYRDAGVYPRYVLIIILFLSLHTDLFLGV
jgi:hypothetical protein